MYRVYYTIGSKTNPVPFIGLWDPDKGKFLNQKNYMKIYNLYDIKCAIMDFAIEITKLYPIHQYECSVEDYPCDKGINSN